MELEKLERAAKSVVTALALSGSPTVNTGQDDDAIEVDNITCTAEDTGDEVPLNSGNFRCFLTVTINSSIYPQATALAVHQARANSVIEAFMADNIGATLSAAVADFYAYEPWGRGKGKKVKEKVYCDFVRLELLAAEADL